MHSNQISTKLIENQWHFFYERYKVSVTDIFFRCLNELFDSGTTSTENSILQYAENKDISFANDSEKNNFHIEWQTLSFSILNFFKTINDDNDIFTHKCQKTATSLINSAFERKEGDAFVEIISLSMETVIEIYEKYPNLGEMISDVLGDGEVDFITDFQESCLWLRDDCINGEDQDALYEDYMEDVVNIVEHTILFSAMAHVIKLKEVK